MEFPKISIITPVYNAERTIEKAIQSVLNQKYKNIEYLFIDGLSNDNTIQIIKRFQKENENIILVSEKDEGIYDAMNKGIDLCRGDWLYFMGADDELYDENVLLDLCKLGLFQQDKVLYGNVYINGDNLWAKDKTIYDGFFDLSKLLQKNICQQSIFYPINMVKEIGYFNQKYIVTGDWYYNLRCFAKKEFLFVDRIIATFSAGGKSSTIKESIRFIDFAETIFNIFSIEIDKIKTESPFYKMVSSYNYQLKTILNPFALSETEGISLFTALKNRSELFEEALKTWVSIDQIDEIIVVDWSSDESILPVVEQYQNGKIKLVVVKDQDGWSQPIAFNLAARFTSKNKIFKVDADVKISPIFFDKHILNKNIFYTGNYAIARNENETHLNGCVYLNRDDFFKVNGFNEFFRVYGYDDTDLYNRLEAVGLMRLDFNLDTLHHIEHGGRTVFQSNSKILRNLNEFEHSRHSILINRYNSIFLKKWSTEDKMLDFKLDEIEENYLYCSQAEDDKNKYSPEIILHSEIDAIKYRLNELGLILPEEILGISNEELIELFNLFLSKEISNYENRLYSLFSKLIKSYHLNLTQKDHEIKTLNIEILEEREKRSEKERVISLNEHEIFEKNQSIEFKDKLINIKNQLLKEKDFLIEEKKEELAELKDQINEKENLFNQLLSENTELKQSIKILTKEIEEEIENNLQQNIVFQKELEMTNATIEEKDKELLSGNDRFENGIQNVNNLLKELESNERRKLVESYKKHIVSRLIWQFINFCIHPFSYYRNRRDALEVRHSGLFDDTYYLEQNPDLYLTTVDMLQHYMQYGWKEGRNPNPLFDANYYLENNADVKKAGINPLLHYVLHGRNEGRKIWAEGLNSKDSIEFNSEEVIHELADVKTFIARDYNKSCKLIIESGLFDAEYYRKTYADIKDSGIDALQHYYEFGWREGRNPSKDFDTNFYLSEYNDIKEADINPLLHYIKQGKKEGRLTTFVYKNKNTKEDTFEHAEPILTNLSDLAIKTIAFYLPQYHPIPENDEWWGKGFTEWTNVTQAQPLFEGHYQPHLPTDLGFYDLRIPEVMKQQIDMAKSFGINGFCFYHYWFDGKRLLDKPLDMFLEHPEWDINFCICWANENWTRRWDGMDNEILIAQNHTPEDDLEFIKSLRKYISDPRYIKVNNKPLIIIYRPQIFPDFKQSLRTWREFCRQEGIGEIHIGMAQTFGDFNPGQYDLDFAVEFPPHNFPAVEITNQIQTSEGFKGHIYDGSSLIKQFKNQKLTSGFTLYKTSMMNWDNTARKGLLGNVYMDINPDNFKEWFKINCLYSLNNNDKQNRFVFVNAWNEWAEGTHLEPCRKWGYAYLNRIGSVLKSLSLFNSSDILVSIIIPIFNGEKYIIETLESIKDQSYKSIEIIIVNDGSTDSSLIKIEDFIKANPSLKIKIYNQENQGAYNAINKGIEFSTGNIIAVCNHDDLFHSERIETLLNEMKYNGSEIAFSKVDVYKQGNIKTNQDDNIFEIEIELKQNEINEYENIGYALLDYNVAISTGNMIFTKELWERVGGFSNLNYCHDWMFIVQAMQYTTPIYVDKPLYKYRLHETNSFKKLSEIADQETNVVLEYFFNNLNFGNYKLLFSNQDYYSQFISIRGYNKFISENKKTENFILINKGFCPVCNTNSEFRSTHRWFRDHYRCVKCNSIPRERAIISVLNQFFPGWKESKTHESSPSNRYFANIILDYSFSQFYPGQRLGSIIDDIRNENIENLTFNENEFDYFICQDVLEHVFNPEKAILDMLRVIKPEGALVFTVPIHKSLKMSIQRAKQLDDKNIKYLLPEQYHGNPIGDGKSLVTWDYGLDFKALAQTWIGQEYEINIINEPNENFGIIGDYLDVVVIRKVVK